MRVTVHFRTTWGETMQYKRTFRFSACHFNDRKAYEGYWRFLSKDWRRTTPYLKEVAYAFRETHGHNFVVTITAQGKPDPKEGWLVEDTAIEKMIAIWTNKNLSVLADFVQTRERATTENMALKLRNKLDAAFPAVSFVVEVQETPDVSAAV
jgi:6-pyruvoyl-tetrahydropterin synthase